MLSHYDVDSDISSSAAQATSSITSRLCKCNCDSIDKKKLTVLALTTILSIPLIVFLILFVVPESNEEICRFPSSGVNQLSTHCCKELCNESNDFDAANSVPCATAFAKVESHSDGRDQLSKSDVVECFAIYSEKCSCFIAHPQDDGVGMILISVISSLVLVFGFAGAIYLIVKKKDTIKEGCENFMEIVSEFCKNKCNCTCCKREVERDDNVFYSTTSSLSGLAMGLVEGELPYF